MSSIATTTRGPETHAQTVTSWLPLTTVYPSISRCANSLYSKVPNTVAAWDPGYGLDVNSNAQCQPSQVTTWWRSQASLLRYSIGPLVCPEAYTTAFTSAQDISSTFVACCPSGYSILDIVDAGDTRECMSQLVSGQVITYGVQADAGWTTSTRTLSEASTAAGIQINGWVFAPETSSESGPTSIPASTSSSTSSTPISQTSNSMPISIPTLATNGSNTGLDVSARIGLGTGLGVVLPLILGLVIFLVCRRRRLAERRRGEEEGEAGGFGGQASTSRDKFHAAAGGSSWYRHGIQRQYKNPSTEAGTLAYELPADRSVRSSRLFHELYTHTR